MSKLAKRLVSPDLVCPTHYAGPDWVLTDGPAVADVCAAAGFAPDPQQELGLDMIFAVGADGLPACFAFCAICCRQNLKTGLLKQAAIGWLYVTEEHRIVWSAHEMDTTREAHSDLANLITETPALARRLPKTPNRGIYDANGQERIELDTGQILKFKARTLSGGRGLTGDKVILDEAFALKPAHVGALLPTMTARPAGQVLYASSAGKADSDVLRDVRDRGRSAASPRLGYVEWLAPREACSDPDCRHPKDAAAQGIDCALDREHLWQAANPTITTGRISVATIAALRQELPPEEFARESLGWWDEPNAGAAAIFGAGRWEACAGEPLEMPEHPTAVGVAVSVDRTWASIASASTVEVLIDPNDPESEPTDRLFVAASDRREDVGWLVDELKRIQQSHPESVIVIDAKGPAKDLLKDFEDADIAIEAVTFDEYAEACSRFFDKVRAGELMHPSSTELDEAVTGAAWRTVGDRQVWGRRKSEVSMLEAATLAAFGAEKFGSGFNIY
ncbi:MAG TPA: hypothetical protein VGF17_20785 [Phytomonospora sp.]